MKIIDPLPLLVLYPPFLSNLDPTPSPSLTNFAKVNPPFKRGRGIPALVGTQ